MKRVLCGRNVGVIIIIAGVLNSLLISSICAADIGGIIKSGAPYIQAEDNLVHIGTDKLEMQISTDGRPVALYDKIASRFIISKWSNNGRFWIIHDQTRKNLQISNTDISAVFDVIKKDGRSCGHWRYDAGPGKCVIDIYITPYRDGSLRFSYAIDNQYKDKLSYFYFPYFCGISKKEGGWAMVPRLNGILHKFENFRNMEYGGPGQLSTMLIGVKAGPSTMLLYPDDVKGEIQFAIAANDAPDTIFIAWDNKGMTLPKKRYESPFSFRLYNVGDTGLRGIAEQYRKWAKQQSWFVTWQDKVKAAPVLKKIANGVIKMTGFEALSGNGYKSYAWKEQHKGLTFNYDNFLKVAEYIETTYNVKPCYRYDGWYGRFDSRYPQYFPVDKRLGDFKAFMDANNKAGRLVYLHTNPIQWDFDTDMFDINKMSQPYPGHYSLSSWSHNRLYFGSPRLILDDEVNAVKQILSYGVRGLFEDVIGCTTMGDTNPRAGYKDEGRAGGTQALLELAAALRKASPGVFRGTEAGAERMLPYYDGFLFGSGNDDFVPFFKMVYGDCFVNMQPIDGGGSGDNFHMIARHLLFGVVLGLDGRGGKSKWSRGTYSPLAKKIFEIQGVAKHTIGKRILNYTWKGTVYLSEWDDCVTVANLGRLPVDKVEFNTTIGKVKVSGMSPNSVAFIRKDGQFASIHCQKISVNGKNIAELNKNTIAVYNGKVLKKIEYVKQ